MKAIAWCVWGAAVTAACGPGEEAPQVLVDMEFSAFVDVDGDGLSHNDSPSTISLGDYLAENRAGTTVIMLNAAAGWCDPCQREAAGLPELQASYASRGLVVLTAVFQDQHGDPADETFTRVWAETFALTFPVLIDTEFQTDTYFDDNVMPANMFVDAETSEILLVATGAEPGADPLREYREFLDAHFASP